MIYSLKNKKNSKVDATPTTTFYGLDNKIFTTLTDQLPTYTTSA